MGCTYAKKVLNFVSLVLKVDMFSFFINLFMQFEEEELEEGDEEVSNNTLC